MRCTLNFYFNVLATICTKLDVTPSERESSPVICYEEFNYYFIFLLLCLCLACDQHVVCEINEIIMKMIS